MDRAACLKRWRESSAAGALIVGAGAGTGISAKCAEAAGADLIIIYNSGRYRMPIVRNTPVLAGVCGTDPFRVMDLFLRDLKQIGFSGVQNFPTVGLIDGSFRESLEETGMGYAEEVDMIARAHALDLITCPYVFNEDEAIAMAKAGADLLIAHMGLTTKGTIGARTALTLDQSVDRIQGIREAAVSIRSDILVLCHGGPIAEPDDVKYVLSRTEGICGFFGASSVERLPTERAITEQVRSFKSPKIQTGKK